MRDVDGNYSDKGFEEKASAAQITYSRKPLSFVLPALRESQAAKNPFRKFYLRLKTTTNIKVTGSSLQGTSDPPPVKKFHSLTPTQQKRTKVTLEKVPKPSLFVSEPVEGDSSPLEDYENSEKEELKKGEKDKELQEPDYEITLTREVMYHFRELEKVGFVSLEEVRKKSITLPDVKGKKKSNKTLLLDLDDTLVHTVDPNLNYSSIKIDTANVKCTMYLDPYLSSMVNLKVVIRPNAMKFLQEISPFYEIVIFTAGQKTYAEALLGLLDPKGELIDYRIYRDKCIAKNGHFLKDLRIFKNREIKNMVLLDNSMVAFANQLDNGIHIPTFFGSKDDTALLKLIPFLKSLASVDNLQAELRARLGLSVLYSSHLKFKLADLT